METATTTEPAMSHEQYVLLRHLLTHCAIAVDEKSCRALSWPVGHAEPDVDAHEFLAGRDGVLFAQGAYDAAKQLCPAIGELMIHLGTQFFNRLVAPSEWYVHLTNEHRDDLLAACELLHRGHVPCSAFSE